MFYQIFLSPQVKWSVIIVKKPGMLPHNFCLHQLPNDLRLKVLGN